MGEISQVTQILIFYDHVSKTIITFNNHCSVRFSCFMGQSQIITLSLRFLFYIFFERSHARIEKLKSLVEERPLPEKTKDLSRN